MGAGGSCCQGAGDDDRMVTKMDLSHCGCIEVPPIVFQAERYVETLNLSHNRILSLPPQLFHCQELKHLKLIDNGLDSIPPAIGSLLHLVSLKLDKNCIKDLPENLKSCRKLKRLSLSNNQLQQLPGTVTQLISLEELYLNDCDISFLPASVGRLTKLRILELRNNRLCNLPLSMSRVTSLTRLDLGDNSFEVLPECLSNQVALQELLLDNNDLEVISGNGLKKLEHLDASYNNLKSVAKDIGQCTSLTLLNLGWNYLENLPETISSLTQVEGLVLEMNELTDLPQGIGKLQRLEELNVSNNRLGDLPPSIGLLRNLVVLNFSRNYVQEIPCEIGSCQRLSIMNASYNRLQSLPGEVGYLNNLKVLDVVGNFLMYLPISMSNLTGLRAIWLSANQNVPLIPFTEDVSMASGERFLTNIALPQLGETALPPVENPEPVEKTSWRRKIRFEEDEDILPGRLDRTPTPFPKELRSPARKTQRSEDNYVNVVDGRVAVFQQAQQPPNGQQYSENNVTVIREANIRKNKETRSEADESEHEQINDMGPKDAIYGQRSTERSVSFDSSCGVDDANTRLDRQEVNGVSHTFERCSEESSMSHGQYPAAVCDDSTSQANGGQTEPAYGNHIERQDNGRMTPISEEGSPQRLQGKAPSAKEVPQVETSTLWAKDVENAHSKIVNGRNDHLISKQVEDAVDAVDIASIDSFESERRTSIVDSMDNRAQLAEMNRNQVIYSNLRNGNVYNQEQRNDFQPGYSTPPLHQQYYRHNGPDSYGPYRNNVVFAENTVIEDSARRNGGNITPNGIRPGMIMRQSPYGTVQHPPHSGTHSPYGSVHKPESPYTILQQSPYGSIQRSPYASLQQSSFGPLRQSPRPHDNGNGLQELERPPSKQEMLSIAERNLSQNIAPPCYEIAKMYSTKAALFEHCHRPDQA